MREVYLGAGGIIEDANPGTLLIDCSTIDVETARAVAAEAEKRGLMMLDAPVSGGVGGAQAATLTFMVGGSEQAFVRAESILQKMGKTIVHAGGPGNGQAAKICNNMILGISMIAVSEAFVLAEQLGLDHQKLFDISSKSSGQCWSLTTYCPVPGPVPTSPANRDYQAGFTAAMMLKDLKLAQEAAKAGGAKTQLGAHAGKALCAICRQRRGGQGFFRYHPVHSWLAVVHHSAVMPGTRVRLRRPEHKLVPGIHALPNEKDVNACDKHGRDGAAR